MVGTKKKARYPGLEGRRNSQKNICKTGGNELPKDSIPSCVRPQLGIFFSSRDAYVPIIEK